MTEAEESTQAQSKLSTVIMYSSYSEIWKGVVYQGGECIHAWNFDSKQEAEEYVARKLAEAEESEQAQSMEAEDGKHTNPSK